MKKKQWTYTDLFIATSLVGFFTAIILWISGAVGFEQSVLSKEHIFADFFCHLGFAAQGKELYLNSKSACFPPLAYCFYYIILKINPILGTDNIDTQAVMGYGNNLLILVIYSMMVGVLLVECVHSFLGKERSLRNTVLGILIICSYPFMATSIQRGNIIAPVAVMICYSFHWMDSENKLKKELSILFLAIAICFKIYPAILGVGYLFDKRYKELLKLVIYTTVLFFVPFMFFGGMNGLRAFTENVLMLASDAEDRWCTVRGFVALVIDGKVSQSHKILISGGCEIVFLIVALWCSWISDIRWKRAFFLGMILVSFVPSNYVYTLVYLMPPLLLLLKEKAGAYISSANEVVAILVFGIVFSMPVWMIPVFRDGIAEGMFKILFLFFAVMAIDTILKWMSAHNLCPMTRRVRVE